MQVNFLNSSANIATAENSGKFIQLTMSGLGKTILVSAYKCLTKEILTSKPRPPVPLLEELESGNSF